MTKTRANTTTLFWVERLIAEAIAKRFYGDMRLLFRDGVLVKADITQSLLPPEPDNETPKVHA